MLLIATRQFHQFNPKMAFRRSRSAYWFALLLCLYFYYVLLRLADIEHIQEIRVPEAGVTELTYQENVFVGPCEGINELQVWPPPSQLPYKPRALMIVHMGESEPYQLDPYFETALMVLYRHTHTPHRSDTEVTLVVHESIDPLKIKRFLEWGGRVIKLRRFIKNDESRGRLLTFGFNMYESIALLDTSMFPVQTPSLIFDWYDSHQKNRSDLFAVRDVAYNGTHFNVGLMIFQPSCTMFEMLMIDTAHDNYDEFDYLNVYFYQRWTEVPFQFCTQYLASFERIDDEGIVFIHDALWYDDAPWRPWRAQDLWWTLYRLMALEETRRLFQRTKPSQYLHRNVSITLASMDIGRDNIVAYFPTTHDAYATKNGYGYRYALHNQLTWRPPVWNKLPVIQQLFDHGFEWVWWIDSDALFLNMNLRVEDHILAHAEAQRLDRGMGADNMDFIGAFDRCGGFNAGSFLIRNTKWSRQFLKFVAELDMSLPPDSGYQEQSAMAYILREKKDFVGNHVEFVQQRLINPYGTGGCGYQYQDGDILAHFPGFKERIPYFIKVSKTGMKWREAVYGGKD